QLGRLARLQVGLVQLVALEAQQRQLALPLLPFGVELRVTAAGLAELGRGVEGCLAVALQVAELGEHLSLVGRLQERGSLWLTVSAHQARADLLEGVEGDGLVVDVGMAAAAAGQAAGEDDLAVLQGAVEDALDLGLYVGIVQLETAGDAQLLGAA